MTKKSNVGRPKGFKMSKESSDKIKEMYKKRKQEDMEIVIGKENILIVTISDDISTESITIKDVEKKYNAKTLKNKIINTIQG